MAKRLFPKIDRQVRAAQKRLRQERKKAKSAAPLKVKDIDYKLIILHHLEKLLDNVPNF